MIGAIKGISLSWHCKTMPYHEQSLLISNALQVVGDLKKLCRLMLKTVKNFHEGVCLLKYIA
jgi:hypothetical protein